MGTKTCGLTGGGGPLRAARPPRKSSALCGGCKLSVFIRNSQAANYGSIGLEGYGVAEILWRKIIEALSIHLCERVHEITQWLAKLGRIENTPRASFSSATRKRSSPPQKNFSHFPASWSLMLWSSIIFLTSAGSATTQPVPGR